MAHLRIKVSGRDAPESRPAGRASASEAALSSEAGMHGIALDQHSTRSRPFLIKALVAISTLASARQTQHIIDLKDRIMKTLPILIAGITTVLAFLCYAAFLVFMSWPVEDWSINKASLFGDSFGVLNSFFTGGAFLLILWTIVLQQAELRLQRQEMSKMVSAHLREIETDILGYAINDPDLAEVYGGPGAIAKNHKQEAYVAMILTQWKYNYMQGEMTPENAKKSLLLKMEENPIFRRYWKKWAKGWRLSISQDKKHEEFVKLCDNAYEATLASSTD